ncbi:hypothetical protein Tco_0790379 [Tanacetum coccineum]
MVQLVQEDEALLTAINPISFGCGILGGDLWWYAEVVGWQMLCGWRCDGWRYDDDDDGGGWLLLEEVTVVRQPW